MTQSTATKPATKPAAAPAFSFSNLSAVDTDKPATVRSNPLAGTPFVEWMKESRAQEKAKAVTVPVAHAGRTVYLIRKAAEEIKVGVSVVQDEPKGGNVRIVFYAKDRKRKLTDAERAAAKAEKERKLAERLAKMTPEQRAKYDARQAAKAAKK